jgi:very-short-patch-repair endonuclease
MAVNRHSTDGQEAVEQVQCGVLTITQATERFGRAALRRHLGTGRWTTAGRHAVVLHNGPLGIEQLLWLAWLSAPPGSALGSWSALALDGWCTAPAVPAHLVIPCHARRPRLPIQLEGTTVTRSAALGDEDVQRIRMPARTRPARSLVDAAVRATRPEQARLALVQGVQAGVTRPADLRSVLERRGQCHHLALLRRTVDDLEGGIRSIPEHRFTLLVRRAGLPEPQRQAVVRGPTGRYYLDADWPEFALSAEVHGIHHAEVRQLERDWQRHNDLTVEGGRRVLHFTSHEVRTRPDAVAAVIARAMFGRRPEVDLTALEPESSRVGR